MAECIEREAAITKIRAEGTLSIGYHSDKEVEDDIVDMLERLPAADVAPVVHGKWEIVEVYGKTARYRCTTCKTEMVDYIGREGCHRYCHICGAKMEEAR